MTRTPRLSPEAVRRGAVVMSAAFVLAACGGSGGGQSGVDYSSASAIAKALDKGGYSCTGYVANPGALGTREDGTCNHGDVSISVTTFNSADQQDAVNRAFGTLMSGVALKGDRWQVWFPDRPSADQGQKILGGKVS